MGKNNRPRTTVTRSISFDDEVFKLMEAERKRLRQDRSDYLRTILEERFRLVEAAAQAQAVAVRPGARKK